MRANEGGSLHRRVIARVHLAAGLLIAISFTAVCVATAELAQAGDTSTKGRVIAAAWKPTPGSSSASSSTASENRTPSGSITKLKWRQHRAAKKRAPRRDDQVRLARTDGAERTNQVRRAVGLETNPTGRREATIDELDPFDDAAANRLQVTPEPFSDEIGKQQDDRSQPTPLDLPPPFDLPGELPRSQEEPTLEELARGPDIREVPCPLPSDLKPITEITDDISAEGIEFPPECTLGDMPYAPRQWAMMTYTWKAPGLCHKPLYFEDVALERYGHSYGPFVQPLISGAHFFATLPILPYKMGLEPPGECVYALGYYRPGSCAPRMILPLGLSLRGALLEAGAWTGMVFLIP